MVNENTLPITKKPLRTHEVVNRLRDRYKAPEYAFFTEVAEGTGAFAGRRADGIAMSLWPSRGIHLTGFEVKVSRSDWLTELKHPEKAEPVAQYCDFWYIVVGDPSIVKPGELPENWGLLIPNGNGLKPVKDAPRKEAKAIGRPFLAAILRRSHEGDAHAREIAAAVSKARTEAFERGQQDGKLRAGNNYTVLEREVTELRDLIKSFEDASGIQLGHWDFQDGVKVGDAVKILMSGGLNGWEQYLRSAKFSAQKIIDEVGVLENVLTKNARAHQ